MLIIHHRSGPLAGKENRVEAKGDRVVFGRDPDACDVVFPPDATLVARRHFALVRKPSGDWTVELFGAPFVAVNGQPAELGAPVRSGSLIELGRRGGPSFVLTIEGETRAGTMAMTLAQEEVTGSHAAAAHAERAAARARRFAYLGLALVLLVAIGGGGLYYQHLHQFTEQLRLLNEAQARFAADNIPREYRDRIARAAYLVVLRDAAGNEHGDATAFPIGENMLATAAHVAENRKRFKETGERMFVRAPGPEGRSWEVTAHKLHPSYQRFDTFLSSDPLYVKLASPTKGPEGLTKFTAGNGYDVAVLWVDGPPLGPILELATPEDIAALQPGAPLAYAGYPREKIAGSEVSALGATPEVRTGIVTALTDPFAMPGDASERRLVHHNMGTTVGASGSPIISTSGRVVALHNRSNYISLPGGGQVPSGALINYAQRSDLVADLLSGKADGSVRTEREYWERQTAKLQRGYASIVPALVEALKPTPASTPVLVSEMKFELSEDDQTTTRGPDGGKVVRRQKVHKVAVRAGSDHALIAYARESIPISLYVFVDKQPVQRVEGQNWYPAARYHADKDGTIEVYVSGPDDDVSYTFVDYVFDVPRS